jgi:hypothetical protein
MGQKASKDVAEVSEEVVYEPVPLTEEDRSKA